MYFFIFRPCDDSLRGVAGSYLLLCRKVRGWAGGKMRLASMNLTARLIWASQQEAEVQHAQKAYDLLTYLRLVSPVCLPQWKRDRELLG